MNRTLLVLAVSLLFTAACGSSINGSNPDTTGTDGQSDGTAENDSSVNPDGSDDVAVNDTPTDPDVDDPDQDQNPDEIQDLNPDKDIKNDNNIDPPDTDVIEDIFIPDGWSIELVNPVEGAKLSGSILVKIIPVNAEELKVEWVRVAIDNKQIFQDTKVPTEFVLDTTKHKVPGFTLQAQAKIAEKIESDSATVTLDNPAFSLKQVYSEEYRYKNGDEVSIFVSTGKAGMSVEANFAAIDSAYLPESEDTYEIGGGKYMINYTISDTNTVPDGIYNISVSASDGVSTIEYDQLGLALNNRPALPIRVQGGIFQSADMPTTTQDWEQQPIGLIYGSDFIITGGSAKVNIDFSTYQFPAEIIGIIVGIEGYGGFFQIPLAASSGEEEMTILLRVYVDGETPPSKLPLKLAVKDVRGRVSNYKTYDLSVQSVGSGDIQVSVSWDTETDVDLHVVEPGGCEMYYAHKQCPSGGWLDLDSNPACSIDHIKNENVFWPEGSAPEGTYTVRVDFYQDCDTQGANYTVTLHYCGDVETVTGSFSPGTDDSGGAGSGVTVATFNNENCGRILRGRIRYEDRTLSKDGFSATTLKPVRYAAVEVHRASDNALLSTGYTDRDGHYEIQFSNKEEPGIYITAKTRTDADEKLREIMVMNHPKFKQVYNVSSQSIDETEEDYPVLNLDIPELVGAGAFNIFDVVIDGYDLIRTMTGANLGPLNIYWATGADTTDTIFCAAYLYEHGVCSEYMALSVQGKDTDRDEYDDMVILKEFFRFAVARVSRDDNPGGISDGTRDDPRRSWSDGVTTFFACDVIDYPYFVNSRPEGVFIVQDLEAMDTPFGYKTSNSTMSGPISPYLVSSVLWDLADSGASEGFDSVSGKRLGVFDSIFHYFASTYFDDRGMEGVDFIDFLDAWFCRGWINKSGVEDLLEERQFPYDFQGPVSCIH